MARFACVLAALALATSWALPSGANAEETRVSVVPGGVPVLIFRYTTAGFYFDYYYSDPVFLVHEVPPHQRPAAIVRSEVVYGDGPLDGEAYSGSAHFYAGHD